MKHLLLFFFVVLLYCKTLYAQSDTSNPLSVTIKIEKEYELTLPKKYFAYEVKRGTYNITTDSVKQKKFDIEVTLKNNSTQPIFIWLMTCSWEDNLRINNNYISIRGHECDSNYPQLVEFRPGESKMYYTTLVKSIRFQNPCKNCIYGRQVETTKLGVILVDDVFKPRAIYDLAMEDKSLWTMIWSNPLYLLTKAEASPEPIQIPVYQPNSN